MTDLNKKARIPIQIRDVEGVIVTETVLLNLEEVLCFASRYIPENSIVFVTILLPACEEDKRGTYKIACEGKISSVEPIVKNEKTVYKLLIFFIGLPAEDVEILRSFLEKRS
ncbi:hypothetical protein ACFL1T_02565 [Chlamydiota bacterium]